MPKFNLFKFKVIETVYNNYKFRSRLEARYAVFFDTLGIEYRYEAEGFDLEGTWYLPDFFLPQQDCFIEIKGQEPTEEELRKAELLALYTGKDVHIFFGEIGATEKLSAYTYPPARLWKYLKTEMLGEASTRRVFIAPDLLALRHKLEECYLRLTADDDENIVITPDDISWEIEEIPQYLEALQQQQALLPILQTFLTTREDEVRKMLIPDEGWWHEFFGPDLLEGTWWGECDACGAFGLSRFGATATHFYCSQEGTLHRNSPRIMEAYAAARQARF